MNVKKYTKDQMAKMVEEAKEKTAALEIENKQLWSERVNLTNRAAVECERANYAEAHPWRNLWACVKRKLGGERNEHVS